MTARGYARVAVVGSGPAGLMAAHVLIRGGAAVTLYEKRRGLGRKLLIAGSSGLNISYECPKEEFPAYYTGPREHFERIFRDFGTQAWLEFIEKEMGIATFKGTSRRYFVEGMKASQLLAKWTESLRALGTEIAADHEWTGIETAAGGTAVALSFARGSGGDPVGREFDAVCLALGGGSWEPDEVPLRWPAILKRKGLKFVEFQSANAGYELDWPEGLLKEAEGKPVKNIVLTTRKATRGGELVITRYGLEGTPVYFAGIPGIAHLDLKPELDLKALVARLSGGTENLSPIRRVKKNLKLGEGALALVFHLAPPEVKQDLHRLAALLKRFPLHLKKPRPLAEAISSSGGLSWDEVDGNLCLKRFPGVFVAGEMLDWEAPTGGFLIQASVSEGHFAGKRILDHLKRK